MPVRIRIPGRPLARRKKKGAKKPHPRIFQIAIACIAAVIVAGGVWVWIQYLQYAKIADQTLARGPIPDTSMLYAAPEMVGPGDPGTPIEVADELQESGYGQDDHGDGLGWFHLEPHAIGIYPGADSDTQGEVPAVLQFNAGKIVSITSLKDQQPLDTYALEPHVLSSLWDKKREKRRVVRYQEIPPVLVHAVISAEDKHFFTNFGFDPVRIAKVAWHDMHSRRSHWVGASTLTQQLARMLWLSNRKTFSRKFAEALITMHLERKLTKQQIFQYYANDVPLGRRGSFAIRGFGEAAQAYFGKSIGQLTLPEAATLAGLVQEPSYRNPVHWPKRAQKRRNQVLEMMRENHYITEAQYQTACATPMKIAQDSEESADAPYFVDAVNERLGDEFPGDDFQTDGARIYTTIDPALQRDAVQAVADGMKKVDAILKARHERLVKRHLAKPGSSYEKAQVALIVLDPHTGEIKALIGGTNYTASQFNHATMAERPSGSAIKPIVYAAALNTAFTSPTPITASTIIADEPTTFSYDGKAYQPEDFERGQWQGNVTVRKAFAESLNVPAVEVAQAAGYGNVANLAHQAGLENIKPTPAEALGAYDVTPLSLARAYTIFANDGVEVEPRFISRIIDKNGTQMWASQTDTKDILDPRVNYLVVSLMQQVMRSGTGAGASAYGFTLPAAGKTGTSPQDAWFAGFTSRLLCVVWVGLDSYHKIDMEGATAALPIWAEFMKLAHQRAAYSDVTDFPMPPGIVSVEIDPLSGDLAGPACPDPRPEYYILGTQPTIYCPLHRSSATEIAGWENSPAAPPALPASPAAAPPMIPGLAQLPPQPGNAPKQQQKKPHKKKKGFFDKLKSIFR